MNTQKFVDRKEEIDFLESQNEERPSFVVLYIVMALNYRSFSICK